VAFVGGGAASLAAAILREHPVGRPCGNTLREHPPGTPSGNTLREHPPGTSSGNTLWENLVGTPLCTPVVDGLPVNQSLVAARDTRAHIKCSVP